MPQPSRAEALEIATFDALLWALSRPGLVQTLPEPGEAAIIAALLDRECRVFSADPLLMSDIMRTGAEVADIDRADHVFLGPFSTPEMFDQILIGSDLYPDEGATVVVRGQIGAGSPLRLSGPGVDGDLVVALGDLPRWFWAKRAARQRYPMGFDLFVLDGAEVVGLPRSCTVEEI
jgi:alpha-D-ribose 1-methylphosphonate 5-triphosphate synthase subunit PhnH